MLRPSQSTFSFGLSALRLSAITFAIVLGACSSCSSPSTVDSQVVDPSQQGHSSEMSQGTEEHRLESADAREEFLSQAIAHLLKSQHVRGAAIDDALSRKAYEQFLQRLDPSKLYLLASDVATLQQSELKFDDQLHSGVLRLAHQGSEMFAKRLQQVSKIVDSLLSKEFDFSKEEFRETDGDKMAWAKDADELTERWRQVLKLDALGRAGRLVTRGEGIEKTIAELKKAKRGSKEEKATRRARLQNLEKALATLPKTEAARWEKVREDLQQSYSSRFVRLADVDALTPAANFVNAITSSVDPHTVYMPPIEKENFEIQMSGSLEGIGAVLTERDHYIAVNSIVPGGASWRQGELTAGDLILSVAQEGEDPVDIGDMKINRVVQMIRGPKGTTVVLTVEKDDGTVKNISIVRDRVEIEASYAQGAIIQQKGREPVGYIYLPSFYGDTRHNGRNPNARTSAEDVRTLLSTFASQNVRGVIMDVRSNGGGLLDDARKMSGLFIKEGPIVQTKMPDGTIDVLRDHDPSVVYDGKVVVLIDRFSASASEILAAALQDYHRAVVVGPGPTHGKGTVQALLDLNRMSPTDSGLPMGVLKLTIQEFYRINGSSTQVKGVTPDIGFPDSFKHIKTGERNLENALVWSEVEGLKYAPWDKVTWDVKSLAANSEARRAKNKYFIRIDKQADIFKARQERTIVPLKESDYLAQQKAYQKQMEALVAGDKKTKPLFSVKQLEYHKPVSRGIAEGLSDLEKEKAKKMHKASQKLAKDRTAAWSEGLAQDVVVDETLNIIADMLKSGTVASKATVPTK